MDIPLDVALSVGGAIATALVTALVWQTHRLEKEKDATLAQVEARRADEVARNVTNNAVATTLAQLTAALDEAHEDQRVLAARLHMQAEVEKNEHPDVPPRRPSRTR